MNTIPIKKFLETHSQSATALILDVTQGAVSQMLKNNRDIYFEVDEEGIVLNYWEKKIPQNSAVTRTKNKEFR